MRDLTTGSLGRHILDLSLPSTIESAVFSASSLVHVFWLGRLGGTALAAVSVGTTLRIALISPVMGLSVGGMALVARYVGARERRLADRAVAQTLLLLLGFVLIISIVGQVMVRTFLGWMGATGSLMQEATAFFRIVFGGLFFMECLPTMSGVMRGAGHPEYVLRANLANVVTLMVLDLLLLSGLGPLPSLGVIGAGWASVLSSAAGVGMQFIILRQGIAGVHLRLADLRPDWAMMGRILKIAMPVSLQRFAPNLGAAVVTRLITGFGTEVLTAYSVITTLFGLLSGPGMGIANAAASLVGQNLGAQRPERSQRSAHLAAYSALFITLAAIVPVAVWPMPMLRLFTQNEGVLAIGAAAVRVLFLVPVFNAWLLVMQSALAGAGEAIWPMWISIGYLWLAQIPLCWGLSLLPALGTTGIWIGLAIGGLAGAIGLSVRFRQGKWKKVVV